MAVGVTVAAEGISSPCNGRAPSSRLGWGWGWGFFLLPSEAAVFFPEVSCPDGGVPAELAEGQGHWKEQLEALGIK